MSLDAEIKRSRQQIVADGYEMSIGEIISLYEANELEISPEYQRLFRWEQWQKTRFIESLLLGLPIPPIFVFQRDDGVWELIDGLQRLSTIFEFVGILRDENGKPVPSSIVEGTKYLPSLAGKRWKALSSKAKNGLALPQQLNIKRARMRIEILKNESDSSAKYELFQRLNTGGTVLSEQEVRNCTMLMIDSEFHDWIIDLSNFKEFRATTKQTERATAKQVYPELVLRFFVYRNVSYPNGLDVHEYLDHGLIEIATDFDVQDDEEREVFCQTFRYLADALGSKTFKKWNGDNFQGKFLISVYEVLAIGSSHNLEKLESLSRRERNRFLQAKAKKLWDEPTFFQNSGAGVRGTTRLAALLPFAKKYMKG